LQKEIAYCKELENAIEVDTIIGDAAYSGKENLKIVSKLNPSITQGFRRDRNPFDFNKEGYMFVCPAGHMAIRKAKQGKKHLGTNQTHTYYFDVEKCKSCSLNMGCYKSVSKSKTPLQDRS
jgi:hypothetical protein